MAKRKGEGRAGRPAHADRCVFCRLSDKVDAELEKHSGVVKHLTTAKRELLEAVREFVDNELDSIEKVLQRRKRRGKRVTRIEVAE